MYTNNNKIFEQLKQQIHNKNFSCLAAKKAFMGQKIFHYDFKNPFSWKEIEDFIIQLKEFVHEQEGTFFKIVLCSFSYLLIGDEEDFHAFTWQFLNKLHEVDIVNGNSWVPGYSYDTNNDNFAFCMSNKAFFVVGMHPKSSRISRQMTPPCIAFNLHEQFIALRERGDFYKFQKGTRKREERLQGSLNPNLSDHGNDSEAKQYSGIAWKSDLLIDFQYKGEERET